MEALPKELERRIRTALKPGEKLLWTGQPSVGRFVWSSLVLFLGGFPCIGFALALIWGAFTFNHDLPVWLGRLLCLCVAMPMLLLGLWLFASPFLMYRRAKRTVYFLTDQRAVAWDVGWFGRLEVRSFQVHMLRQMKCREYRNGSGDLVFERLVSRSMDSDKHVWTRVVEHGFFAIKNVREVEALVRGMLLAWK